MKHLNEAKPYSDAAYLFAKEKKQIELWRSFLKEMAFVAKDPEIQSLMKHPKLSTKDLVEILANSFEKTTPEIQNFLMLLGENNRLNLLPEMSELFEKDYQQDQHISEVTLTFAAEPTEAELKTLRSALEKKFGEQVQHTVQIDPSLLSGVIIHSGDCVIDGSLRGQLNNLKHTLIK